MLPCSTRAYVALSLFLGLAQKLSSALVQAREPDLREVFKSRRCLPPDRESVFQFETGRSWILEVNPWASHRVGAAIAAILLREHVGYDVDLNVVDSTTEVYHRVAKVDSAASGAALAERHAAGDQGFGYANLEVWPEGKREAFEELVAQPRRAVALGLLGYEGREGWFVPASFAQNPAFKSTPEFYRAYDTTRNSSAAVLAALRQHSTVACGEAPCCCAALGACPAAAAADPEQGEVAWCPEAGEGRLPAVLVVAAHRQEGLQEELARSNGFRFALRFLGRSAFARLASEALGAERPQVVHAWRPSTLLARMRHRSVEVSRVLLPTEACGRHAADGSGDWACDMPRQALEKLASVEVRSDPVARDFFSRFSLPESRSTAAAPGGALADAGVRELLAALVELASGEARPARDEEVFDVACQWVLANEATWRAWSKPRELPFFADTLAPGYPLPVAGALLLLAAAYVACLEGCWLRTTLSPRRVGELLRKNAGRGWRSSLELRLRKCESPNNSPDPFTLGKTISQEEAMMPRKRAEHHGMARSWSEMEDSTPRPSLDQQRYWQGLGERSVATPELQYFWRRMEERLAEAKARWSRRGPAGGGLAAPKPEGCVHLARHVFPCMEASGEAVVMLCRSLEGKSAQNRLVVEACVEASDGEAKAGKDFQAGTQQVVFPPGSGFAVLRIPVVHHKDTWRNCSWFQVRLTRVVEGEGVLAAPAKASVLVLSDNRWPSNIPDHLRGGMGINLMRYFIHSDRIKRGRKWEKTMLAMVWLPVHTVLVSTVVQKIMVDHAAHAVLTGDWSSGGDPSWPYVECVLLVLLQLLSLGLKRWADVVQTRNRGRTGGIRAVHRETLLRKFIFLEHADHWEASEASWLYASTHDVEIITVQAYWQVFILAQSCSALFLSVLLIIILAMARQGTSIAHPEMLLYPLGVFLLIPLGMLGVWIRRMLLWVVILARKSGERDWYRAYTWVISHWKEFSGILSTELVSLEKCVKKTSAIFVPLHWDARDTMNDTAWITHWIQGIAYCFMLLLGSFSLIEYQTYGIGAMEVGTFYAFCKIYLSVGKYVGRLAGVFVHMQQAVVSLREIAALLNLAGQSARRSEAQLWARLGAQGGGAPPGHGLKALVLEEGLCFLRPRYSRVGSLYGELRLARRCELPLGRAVAVEARNERVLRSFLALAAQVLQPTGPEGQELPERAPTVLAPPELRALMAPSVPASLAITASSIEEQLEMTGASTELCSALAKCVGLEPSREFSTLGPGSGQVFSLLRLLLADPDVLVAFRPLNLVPSDVRRRVVVLLRVWQACGGLPAVAALLGVAPAEPADQERAVYRSPERTMVLGNVDWELWEGMEPEVSIDLDALLWRGEAGAECGEATVAAKGSGLEGSSMPPTPTAATRPLLRAAEDAAAAGCGGRCLGVWGPSG